MCTGNAAIIISIPIVITFATFALTPNTGCNSNGVISAD